MGQQPICLGWARDEDNQVTYAQVEKEKVNN